MRVLGIAGGELHDPAAALCVDGVIVAAAEEERFCGEKHAPGRFPVEAARWCLAHAGLGPGDLDAVALSWSPAAFARWRGRYARAAWAAGRPGRAWKVWTRGGRAERSRQRRWRAFRATLELPDGIAVVGVEHHLAHAASAALCSGHDRAAVFTADSQGELPTTLCAVWEGGALRTVREWALPDSLGMFYSAVTDFLGCPVNDGEHRVMGMAAYGDPAKANCDDLLRIEGDGFRVDTRLLASPWRFDVDGVRRCFSPALIERWGPPRTGDALSEPYVHIAAAAQQRLEQVIHHLITTHLGGVLQETGTLCLAGGVLQNVVANGTLLARDDVARLYVAPAAPDAGGAIGAALWAALAGGDTIAPIRDAALGPEEDDAVIAAAFERRGLRAQPCDPVARAADLIAGGAIVAWVQGRLEFGPRALGHRSVLARADRRDLADAVNAAVKFREPWRPFGPSLPRERAAEWLQHAPDSPFMSVAVPVTEAGAKVLAGVVHADGTVRPQTVERDTAPQYHALLEAVGARTGAPALLNTSLNRRGEPMARGIDAALEVFLGSGLQHLIAGGYHLDKRQCFRSF
ncbi:MAG: carbamoyltransferase family protein [Planctomycetota bacterium]|jgi:carbamoyltransferase